jgi:xeroderma pigmentosum group C-complementing protein
MFAEAHPSGLSAQGVDRPTKRRRVGERQSNRHDDGEPSDEPRSQSVSEDFKKPLQAVYDIDASEESDMEWEDVELGSSTSDLAQPPAAMGAEEPLQITLEKHDPMAKQKAVPRRKPVTVLEKKCRLDIHKTHVLCLLSHVQLRNLWCNDEEVQVAVSSGAISDPTDTGFRELLRGCFRNIPSCASILKRICLNILDQQHSLMA